MKQTINQIEVNLLRTYAECWNTLDVSKLEPLLAEGVVYDSQWVLESIQGKHAFLNYFSVKLSTLRGSVAQTQVNAELRVVINYLGFTRKPCLEITQRNGQDTTQVHLLIQELNGKIAKIDLCFIPCHFIIFPEN